MSLVLGLEHSCPGPRRGSVLEKAVLGLGFFCVLSFGLEPYVLDSTSDLKSEDFFNSSPIICCLFKS